ncbi:MAG: hypothetical protein K2J39_06165 [Ruminococcus sp.]|nr:hypothetical protein [Ruminococcus sp.]
MQSNDIDIEGGEIMEYTFECCNLCRKAEKCRKSFPKMVKCQQKLNEWKYPEETYDFYEDNFSTDMCYNENFNEYRCKSCSNYDSCFYNYCASEVEADNLYRAMQGEPLEKIFGGTYVNTETTISTGDLTF